MAAVVLAPYVVMPSAAMILRYLVVHPVLQMWMHSNFDWYNMINSTGANNKEDASECLMLLIELINKGSVPFGDSYDNNSTGVSLSEILFSFMLEKYIVCDACWLRFPSFESSSVLYITPTCTSSMHELIKQGMGKNWKSPAFDARRTLGMSNLIIFYNLLNIWLLLLMDFRYINNNFTKGRWSIPMDMTVLLGLHQFSLQATIDHHGPSMYSGHYTAFINCCKRTFCCNDSKITEFEMIDTKNSSTAYVVMYRLIT